MRIRLLSVLLLITISKIGHAQYYDASPSLVLGAELGNAMGDLSKSWSVGGGVAGKFRLPAGLLSDVIISGNIMGFAGKTPQNPKDKKQSLAKIFSGFVGYRYYLTPLWNPNSFYIQGDVGMSAITSKIINPVIAPSIGYLINDKIDLALRYQSILSGPINRKYSFISFGFSYGFDLK